MPLTRRAFIDDLLRLSQVHPSLLWDEKIVEFAPEVSHFVLTTDQATTIIVAVRDGPDGARVMVDEYVFDVVPAAELSEFLAAVLDGDWVVRPKQRLWKPSRMVVRRGPQCWES